MDSFSYYQHMLIPNCEPHEIPNLSCLNNGLIWNSYGLKAVICRYTTNYDGLRGDWYYVIKDTPFDISKLKSKRRYVVLQGERNFEIRLIHAEDYKEELYSVVCDSLSAYPKKYRPVNPSKENFISSLNSSSLKDRLYGAFYRDMGKLCGYAFIHIRKKVIDFSILKTIPSFEKLQVNAALIYGILSDCNDLLSSGFYICDGSKSVFHETNFQDYLEKYFAFRKAYVDLHIVYNPKYRFTFKVLYRLRFLFYKLDSIRLIHKLNAIFKMQECAIEKL